jgi:nucleoside phosphorylase
MQIDVLVITALYDELQAVLCLGEDGKSGWEDESDLAGFRYHIRKFPLQNKEQLTVAVAWSGAMGETAAANRARGLIQLLNPFCIAMCGICAGKRGDVFLGDVIVADRVFSYDHGKLIAREEAGKRVEQLFHDIETYNLDKTWAMEVAYFAQEWKREWQNQRPLSLEIQRECLLHAVYAQQTANGKPPAEHEERDRRCPSWTKAIDSLQTKKLLLTDDHGQLVLTDQGRQLVLDKRVRNLGKIPDDPQFRVHVGPIATGKTVRQDADLFQTVAQSARKVLGVEMEAAAIGWVAELSGIPYIIAKAVSDYGDADKDDGFREFACRASAEFLFDFLVQHPPRTLNRNKYLADLSASGNPVGNLIHVELQQKASKDEGYISITESSSIAKYETTPLETSQKLPSSNQQTDITTPQERSRERTTEYQRTQKMFLVHVLTPSDKPNQKYDIYIYAKRHKDEAISDVLKADFFFGQSWGNQIFPGTREGNRIGVATSAFGSFLCTCLITFDTGSKVMLHRYIDFEMGSIVDRQAQRNTVT